MAKKVAADNTLDLNPLLGRVKNRINMVGIEFEGGWHDPAPGLGIIRDGSVFAGDEIKVASIRQTYPKFKIGEVPSPPLEPITLDAWVKKFHPNVVDHTCGLHVHMSFKSAVYYEMLTDKAYMDTLVKYLDLWGRQNGIPTTHNFWKRLAGNNQYCRKTFHPLSQILAKEKAYDRSNPEGRYTFLNYCYRYRGTIECRVLPMFDTPATSLKAIKAVIDITNASLVALAKKTERIHDEVVMSLFGEEEVDLQRL